MSATNSDAQPDVLAGVTVTLTGDHAMAEPQQTDMSTGGYAFTGLRAGTYTVEISGFPEDVAFDEVSMTVEVGVGDVGKANFEGAYIRTSAVEGRVIIEGEGLAGVMVTLVGGPGNDSYTKMTGANGEFTFTELRPGDYQVSISGYDAEDYEFASNSHDVSVDLDETETVSFTGVLLRTSGISGRVGVPGMGLPDIAVTLSGAADESAMTDASGQYAFSGLAAGDYTVSIAVTSDAYVFESMSSDVTLGDDDSQIVNFEGAHATTASVSGMLFLDELDKNNEHDAGEHPLPAADVPLALVGPGVNDQRLSATNAAGQFLFPGLRAGSYQLIVPINAQVAAALAANDIAYGGPAVGYGFGLAVGEQKTQAIPFDITHTTINVAVTLKGGDYRGDPIPGASVSLYAAAAGGNEVGSGATEASEAGVYTSIKVARAGTSDNTVYMGVAADGYFVDPTAGMQAVTWDPQSFVHPAAGANPPAVLNDADIVNLNVNVNISGATVDRGDYGGGEALAGWAISVMSGEDAVPGAPTMLDDDGNAAFTTVVAPDALPATFTFAADDDQDDKLDGGEDYESSGGMYTHTGLKLAGTAMDADPIVVTYTTQTLKVYVHHELDQVRGYTGNVLGGDVRAAGLVDLAVRQASGNDGRFTSPISNDDWDSRANSTGSRGAYTFSHLPAGMNIVVHATARDDYMLLDLHGLDTYRNMAENGIMGGAFGDMGGWGHTVTLCPLTEVEPTGQDFGKCASFAVVTTHDVSANVSKVRVRKSGTAFHSSDPSTTHHSELTVSLTPVEGKNLAGVGGSFTTAKSDDPTTDIDERTDHDFGTMAAGAYKLGLPGGWRAMVVDDEGAASTLSPLGSDVQINVTPSTATLYGFVRSEDGFGLEGVTVTVNGMTATTDGEGRYIVSGISPVRGQLFVNTERAGYPATRADSTDNAKTAVPEFAANTAERWDFSLRGANNTVAITGVVSEAGTGTGIKGAEIKVDGKAPLNAGSNGKLTTGDDGSYTAVVETQPFDDPLVNVSATLKGWHFLPASFPVPAIAGSNGTANFEGRRATEIVGRVTAPGGGMPRAEVTVTAYGDAARSDKLYEVTTTETGTFSVFVPTLSGSVYLDAKPQDDYGPTHPNYVHLSNSEMYVWFDHPANRPDGSIAVIPGQVLQFGTFTGNSVQPRITSVKRGVVEADTATIPDGNDFQLVKGEPTNEIEVKWEYDTRNDDAATDDSYSVADGATITLGGVTGGTSETLPAVGERTERTGVADGTTVTHTRTTTHTIGDDAEDASYGDIKVTVGVEATDAGGTDATATSASVELAAVETDVTDLEADRAVTEDAGDRDPHMLTATWDGTGSPGLEQRVVLRVQVEGDAGTVGRWQWVVMPSQPVITRATAIPGDTGPDFGDWSSAAFDLNLEASAEGDWLDADQPELVYAITAANLKAASHLRIDTMVDGGDWVTHTPAAIPGG